MSWSGRKPCAHSGCSEMFASFGFRAPEGHPKRHAWGFVWYCGAHREEGETLLFGDFPTPTGSHLSGKIATAPQPSQGNLFG